MSPAKRLSRQRFRALCERCRAYLRDSDGPVPCWRTFGFVMARQRAYRRAGADGPFSLAMNDVAALARLAR